jgi:hypothetical protein
MHDVELPAVARQVAGYSETWYFMRDDEIVAHAGDNETVGAEWMLRYDLEDDQATIEDGLSADELPSEFRNIAADGGSRE